MSEAKKIAPMQVWAIMDPERYIKKSIRDGSLAIYEERQSAEMQVSSVSEANDECCFIEEMALCNKTKLNEYAEVHDEMYELLERLINPDNCKKDIIHIIGNAESLLAKARGEK